MNAKVLDENGKLQTVVMGCYGIGVSRIAAATIEQSHDENGIIWPVSIAPYEVSVIATNVNDERIVNIAEKVYNNLLENNIDVIIDDRKEKAGFKFKDADLIGIPIKVIVGKNVSNNIVEVKNRKTNESLEVNLDKVLEVVKELLGNY